MSDLNPSELLRLAISALTTLADDVAALITAAEVVVIDAGEDATGDDPDPNLAELAYCLEALASTDRPTPSPTA